MRLGLSEFESAVGKHERYHAKKPKAWLGQMGNPLNSCVLKSLHHPCIVAQSDAAVLTLLAYYAFNSLRTMAAPALNA